MLGLEGLTVCIIINHCLWTSVQRRATAVEGSAGQRGVMQNLLSNFQVGEPQTHMIKLNS